MYEQLKNQLKLLQRIETGALAAGKQIGLEKETLRVNSTGAIANSPHPAALGAALCNPYITTDYSEALLEIVTPPLADADSALTFLQHAHQFIAPRLAHDEYLWATSMPCILSGPENIPIGRYGNSNAGKMKHVYRKGLGLRYGKAMQTIAGVHFNFSWPKSFWSQWCELQEKNEPSSGYVTRQYFHMTRNLLRYGWMVPYLFGASPAICKTFLQGQAAPQGMQTYGKHTYFEPYGTSLRMGDIGYQYRKDSSSPINVSYSGVAEYVRDLYKLMSSQSAKYESIGLLDENGNHQQLNTNRLQIENEYYSSVRPKQIPQDNEMPIIAMAERGIRYLELRSVDVNIFEPLGIDIEQLLFLETFMLFSLLHDSPVFSEQDMSTISENMSRTAHRGRDPALLLGVPGDTQSQKSLVEWGLELLQQMEGVAAVLDDHNGTDRYVTSLRAQREKFLDVELTPSARILREMHERFESFYEFAHSWSLLHRDSIKSVDKDEFDEQFFLATARESLHTAAKMEAESAGSFTDYLAEYFAQLDKLTPGESREMKA